MNNLLLIFFWVILGSVAAYYAKKRGRNPYVWFFIGLIFGVLGLIALFILSQKNNPTTTVQKKGPSENTIEVTAIPVPPPSYQKKFWYYLDAQRKQCGPISFEKLKSFFKEGEISFSTYTWCEELTEWKPLKEAVPIEDLNS